MEQKLWIDGRWQQAEEGGVLEVENPATGEIVDTVANAAAADVDKAVAAAKAAFADGRWSQKSPGERSDILNKMAALLEERSEEFARVESEDSGKPYDFVSLGGDLPFSVDNLRFFASAAREISGSAAGEYATGYTSMLRREPCGVTAGIAPWNYPLLMAIWKIGPALAAGCTSIIKPASLTPRTTLMLGELSREAGLPDGVLNILSGGAGRALVAHEDVQMVSLTGATETGKALMRSAADTLKRVHLELGGKAPLIVFDDADVAEMAEKAAMGGFVNSGQDCTAATRLLIHESVMDEAKEALVAATNAFIMGDPFDKATMMGSMISEEQQLRVAGFVDRARDAGATVLAGGEKGDGPGYFYKPTLLDGVGQEWEVVQEELFGPVMTLQSFSSDEEALQLANDVRYGLASSVFTKDVKRAMRFAADLQFGTVWVNDHLPLASETPHGGFKQSGFGKDLSAEAVSDYLVTKHVMVAL